MAVPQRAKRERKSTGSTPRTATRSTTRHRRTSGAIRKPPSGRYQARYTGPDGTTRPLGTFATKTDADRALASQTVAVARGAWIDPAAGDVALGGYVQAWIATRDLAPSTRELYTGWLTPGSTPRSP
jgi:hypothetical protein